jgi:uncharacterized repeat protein (TIGR01451 family)
MGAGARRSLVLLWTAVFLGSLLLQYMSFAAPATTLAAFDSNWELDGNVEEGAAAGGDWNDVNGGSADPFETVFITDPINGNGDAYFTGGDTKDIADIPDWLWTINSQPQDKNDISNAYAAAFKDNGDLIVYFGLDRYASNGAAQVGFWFLQDDFGLTGGPTDGGFSGKHVNGDVLVQIDFENGGANPVLRLYEWQNGLTLVSTGGSCATAGSSTTRCAIAATASTNPTWPFDDKFDPGTGDDIPAGGFVEGGINLTDLGLDDGCFADFVAETRSSPSADSTLSDFASGDFELCDTPDIETQVWSNGSNLDNPGTINKGESVTDKAALTGDNGTVTGSVEFFVCYDSNSYPDCDNGGTKVGGAETLSGGEAESDSFTPTQIGRYCFRVEYTPAAGSKYLAAEHTNKTSECFRVIPADVRITKVAADTSVSAGDDIAFTVTWSNVGEGKATDVDIIDVLPNNPGLDWSIDSFTGSGTACAITDKQIDGKDRQVLECLNLNINGNTDPSGSVTVTSGTTPETCVDVNNRADITSGNDGSGHATAEIDVLCPDVRVLKTPDAGDPGNQVSKGDNVSFTINVKNIGEGIARNVTLTDNLPNGVDWATTTAGCSIAPDSGTTGQVLSCSFGDLDPNEEIDVVVTGDTDLAACGPLNNTATATSTNEGTGDILDNNTNSGVIDVRCAGLDIEKDADPDGPVNAGDEIGFNVTLTNTGAGTAYNVDVTDTLPAGLAWSIETPVSGWSIVGGTTLKFTAPTFAGSATTSVRIVADTDASDCTLIDNTASVVADFGLSDSDSDSVRVRCPDIDIVKTAVPVGPVNAGDEIGFSITVSNSNAAGTGTAYDVEASDTLPAGFAWNVDPLPAGWSYNPTTRVLSFAADEFAAGASSSVTVTAVTTSATCGLVDNSAWVDASNDDREDAEADVTINCPDIKVEKTPDQGDPGSVISAGDDAVFQIVVTNLGPGTAYDVTLDDQLPGGIAWDVDNDTDCTISDTGFLECDFGDLAEDGTRTITITGQTVATNCGTLLNDVEVEASNEAPDKLANNEDDAQVVVNCPDLAITKTADPIGPVNAGDEIGFTIIVSNNGAGTAYDVSISDTLPTDAGLNWTIASTVPADADFSIDGGILTFGPANLLKDQSVSVTITSPTTPATCDLVDNTAAVYLDGEFVRDDDDDVLVECPDVEISKTADNSPILAGQAAEFTVSAWNNGPGLARDVEIHDMLPVGYDWSEDSDACDIVAGELICQLGDIEDDSDPFVVHLSAPTDVEQCADIPNLASVEASNEPEENEGNNESDDEIDVQCADISLVKTAGDAPDDETLLIATLGEVEFTYVVENTGTATLVDVELIDDNATPADPSDDVIVDCPKTTLEPGESMTCTATLPIEDYGLRTNIAVVYGYPEPNPEEEVKDDDDATVNVPEPVVTPTPRITPPPTDGLVEQGTDSGNGLFLLLAALAGVMLTAGYLVPVTVKARRSTRR